MFTVLFPFFFLCAVRLSASAPPLQPTLLSSLVIPLSLFSTSLAGFLRPHPALMASCCGGSRPSAGSPCSRRAARLAAFPRLASLSASEFSEVQFAVLLRSLQEVRGQLECSAQAVALCGGAADCVLLSAFYNRDCGDFVIDLRARLSFILWRVGDVSLEIVPRPLQKALLLSPSRSSVCFCFCVQTVSPRCPFSRH